MTRRTAAALAAAALLLSACGGDSTDTATASPDSCPGAPRPVEPPPGATTDLDVKPEVEVPSTPAPASLEVSDVVVGEGDLACSGAELAMQYVGVLYADGKQFDASWHSGEPFAFGLGEGRVIGGWDAGILWMREGGRRQLVIPPDLGYGEQGAGQDIPPGATLVFIVDLLEVA